MEQGIIEILKLAIQQLNTVFSDLTVHLTTSPAAFAGGEAWRAVTTVNAALKGTGYGLLMLFFLLSFCKSTINFRDLSLQQIIGLIVRFLLVKIVIDYGLELLNFVIGLSMGINDVIFSNMGDFAFAELPQEVLDAAAAMESAQWYERLGAFFQSIPIAIMALLGAFVVWISGIIMTISVYLRFFKVYIYTAIAPIPLSTFGGSETSQTGKHFLKAYAAICLEICVIALAILIFNAMMSANTVIWPSLDNLVTGVNADYWNVTTNYIFQTGLQTILLVTVVTGANRFIRDALGA